MLSNNHNEDKLPFSYRTTPSSTIDRKLFIGRKKVQNVFHVMAFAKSEGW